MTQDIHYSNGKLATDRLLALGLNAGLWVAAVALIAIALR